MPGKKEGGPRSPGEPLVGEIVIPEEQEVGTALERSRGERTQMVILPDLPTREALVNAIARKEISIDTEQYDKALERVADALQLTIEALRSVRAVRDYSGEGEVFRKEARQRMFEVLGGRFRYKQGSPGARMIDAILDYSGIEAGWFDEEIRNAEKKYEAEQLRELPEFKELMKKIEAAAKKVNAARAELLTRLESREDALEYATTDELDEEVKLALSNIIEEGELEFEINRFDNGKVKLQIHEGEMLISTYDEYEGEQSLVNAWTLKMDATPDLTRYLEEMAENLREMRQRDADRARWFEDEAIKESVEGIEQARAQLLEQIRSEGGKMLVVSILHASPEIKTAFSRFSSDGKMYYILEHMPYGAERVELQAEEDGILVLYFDRDNKQVNSKKLRLDATPGHDNTDRFIQRSY